MIGKWECFCFSLFCSAVIKYHSLLNVQKLIVKAERAKNRELCISDEGFVICYSMGKALQIKAEPERKDGA